MHCFVPITFLNSPLIFVWPYDRDEAAAVLLAALADVKPAILATNAMAQYKSRVYFRILLQGGQMYSVQILGGATIINYMTLYTTAGYFEGFDFCWFAILDCASNFFTDVCNHDNTCIVQTCLLRGSKYRSVMTTANKFPAI